MGSEKEKLKIIEEMLATIVPKEYFDRSEQKYLRELEMDGHVSIETKFGYAFCLVRSAHKQDILRGIELLKQLMQQNLEGRRDCLYSLALAEARMKNYIEASNYCQIFLDSEENEHVRSLKIYVLKCYDNDLKKSMAVAGGYLLLFLGGILGMGLALAKK